MLREKGFDLPLSARTLLRTPQVVMTQQKSGMEYISYQLNEQIIKALESYPEQVLNEITHFEISLNVDGLPIFKSAQKSIWPILCAVHLNPITVFPVALTYGRSKPDNLDFLHETISHMKLLLRDGLMFRDRRLQVKLRCIVCDAPARAMVKSVKQYSGYYGCDRCTQKGRWLNKVTYQRTQKLRLRTDGAFRVQLQEEHHRGVSPFCDLPIDMITAFPLDYMHMCCLGVMKRLLLVWLRGKRATRLSATQVQDINDRLLQLRQFIPNVFVRKPRGLDEIDRWKATELRQFLLYTGRLVLNGIIPQEHYRHFLTFSVAMCILISPKLVRQQLAYARDLLQYFVAKGRQIYGPELLVYNVHGLLHLADDAQKYGGLDNCSAFPFENYLQSLKKLVRNGNNPLVQLVKRLSEIQNSTPGVTASCKISGKRPNNCFVLDDGSCCESIEDKRDVETDTMVTCRVYERLTAHSKYPCDSRILGIYKGSTRFSRIKTLPAGQLTKKAILIEGDFGDFRSVRPVTFLSILQTI